MSFDLARIRRDFPILERRIHQKPLVYLDSAATTLKPRPVIEAIQHYYAEGTANIHRGVYLLSEEATESFERTRGVVQAFLNAAHEEEIIFTSGTTHGINLVCHSYLRSIAQPGDEVVISTMEHHANIVPWQILAKEKGLVLKVIPINDDGELIMEDYLRLLSPRTRLVAVAAVSNALGTVNPVAEIIAAAHAVGAKVLLDAAQLVQHEVVDVQALGCDFLVFSGHKIYGPTGTGILYGRRELLEMMPPLFGGGDMIDQVRFEETTFAPLPARLEPGTPHIAGFIGLGAALNYVSAVGLAEIKRHEQDLLAYGTQVLSGIKGLRMIGTARHKAAVLAFVLEGVHAHDLGTILDREGVAVRTGHHCAQPLTARFNISATTRASLGMYNQRQDLDVLAAALLKAQRMFQGEVSSSWT